MIETLWQDVRYGIRMSGKHPGFTAVVVLTLALGIGANTAIFSVVNTVLLRPLPYHKPERLVMVWDKAARLGLNRNLVSPANYFDWQRQNQCFESIGAYTEAFFNSTGDDGGNPERIAGMIATPGFFDTLGVRPSRGRAFLPEEGQHNGNNGAARPAIISHGLWQRRFGSDPELIGKTITLNGGRYTLVGVMPQNFAFSGKKVDAFIPFAPNAEQINNRRGRYLTVVARLKPNVTLAQAQAEMDALTDRLAAQYPDVNEGHGANVSALEEEVFGGVRPVLFVLLGAVSFVLAVACANVANLLLARASSRRREFAIRAALGASRLRVIRQLLTESILLALSGGALGLLLARWGIDLIVALSPAGVPRISGVGLDGRVLGWTLLVSLATGVVFGLLPALQASKTDLHGALKEGGKATAGRGRSRARNTLVVAEVALSLVLLVGAGLMIKSFVLLLRVDPGFVPDNTVAMDISLPNSYSEPQQRAAFFRQVIGRIEALPGVRSAGVIDNLPLSGEDASRAFTIVGDLTSTTTEKPMAEHRRVSSDYFDAMGISLPRGRAFTERDTEQSAGVVIVNEAFARRFLPNRDPLGKRLLIEDGHPRGREIVGVVRDVRHFGLDGEAKPEMYLSHLDRPWPNMTLVVRAGAGDPDRLVVAVRGEVAWVDKSIPLANIKTMDQYLSSSIAPRRFSMQLLAGFAGVALLLAGVGIYGVTAYSVTERTNEMGIRMALGAQASDVLRMVVRQGMILALVGIGIGVIAAFALMRLIANMLYGVSAADPVIFAGVSILLAAVALLACYIPARRATKVDPLIALRYE